MTRRAILGFAAAAAAPLLAVPVRLVTDSRAGILLQPTRVEGEIKRSPAGRPQFAGLARGAVHIVITGRVPVDWDSGRGLAGVSTRYEGCALSVIALQQAAAGGCVCAATGLGRVRRP
jgi:hypothetical protein